MKRLRWRLWPSWLQVDLMVELKVRDLIKALGLEVLSGEEELGRKLKVADINRPGLVLAGFL
ncbi:MAG: hypothetical protein ACOY3H_07920, partial [Bacillota bacterium]